MHNSDAQAVLMVTVVTRPPPGMVGLQGTELSGESCEIFVNAKRWDSHWYAHSL